MNGNKLIGTIAKLWRYPVKSMRGEEVNEVFMGFSGIYGDRRFAIKSSAARKGFPYLNASALEQMLTYAPRFRRHSLAPPNLAEASAIPPGVNPANPDPEELAVDVVSPSGEVMAIDDPRLLETLRMGLDCALTLTRSDRSLVDCRPVSMISNQSIERMSAEMDIALDKRRFRANIYFDLAAGDGFSEDSFVGKRLRIGNHAEVLVTERDPRCKIMSLDPETGEHNPGVLRHLAKTHEACIGVYCAVVVEGMLTRGDNIHVLEHS